MSSCCNVALVALTCWIDVGLCRHMCVSRQQCGRTLHRHVNVHGYLPPHAASVKQRHSKRELLLRFVVKPGSKNRLECGYYCLGNLPAGTKPRGPHLRHWTGVGLDIIRSIHVPSH